MENSPTVISTEVEGSEDYVSEKITELVLIYLSELISVRLTVTLQYFFKEKHGCVKY